MVDHLKPGGAQAPKTQGGSTSLWISMAMFVNNTCSQVERYCSWAQFILQKFFLKSTPTFLFFTSNQSFFITFQIKKSVQNKIFHFFYIKHSYFFLLISITSATVPFHFSSHTIPKHSLCFHNKIIIIMSKKLYFPNSWF